MGGGGGGVVLVLSLPHIKSPILLDSIYILWKYAQMGQVDSQMFRLIEMLEQHFYNQVPVQTNRVHPDSLAHFLNQLYK